MAGPSIIKLYKNEVDLDLFISVMKQIILIEENHVNTRLYTHSSSFTKIKQTQLINLHKVQIKSLISKY